MEEGERKTGIVPGIVFGIILLFISYFILSLTFFYDACTPSDPVMYEKFMEEVTTPQTSDIIFIVLGGIGTLGAVYCISASSIARRNRRSAGMIVGFAGSSILLFTVIITALYGSVPMTYPSVSAFVYSAVALPCAALGFIGSAIIKRKNIMAGIFLLVSAAVMLIEISLQTMVFAGAGLLLLLLGGIFTLIEEKPQSSRNSYM